MPLTNVTQDIVDGKRIVTFSIHKADLDKMLHVRGLLRLMKSYADIDGLAVEYNNLVQVFETAHKRRVAIEDGVIGPVTKEKQPTE